MVLKQSIVMEEKAEWRPPIKYQSIISMNQKETNIK
jgi:hypothetical protein